MDLNPLLITTVVYSMRSAESSKYKAHRYGPMGTARTYYLVEHTRFHQSAYSGSLSRAVVHEKVKIVGGVGETDHEREGTVNFEDC